MTIEVILVWAALLLLVSILASRVSAYLGVPALLLFLLIGMLAGSEGPGGVYFDDPWFSQLLSVVALAFILFSGGLDTQLRDIRPVLRKGLLLSTFGVFVTALSVGWVATVLLDFSFKEGVLLGAIVSSTDAAAVFAVLRAKNVGLKGNLKPLLELESGSNDPMAIFLTAGMIRLIETPAETPLALIPMFVQQMVVGAAAGYGIGRLGVIVINRLRLEYEGLYPVLTIALVLLAYGATTVSGGNGFLAVYLAGVITGNSNFVHKASLRRFHEGLAWLMQIAMFLTLGLLVFPSELTPVIGNGLLIALFLMLVARPASVFLSLGRSRMTVGEKTFVSWVGLRGAAPIILATFPLLAGLSKADTIFNLVFFIVLTSVLVQGTTLNRVARWLGVDEPGVSRPVHPLELTPSDRIRSELIELTVPPNAHVAGRQLVNIDFPEGTLVVLLGRGERFIVPTGSTTLEEGDLLLILADRDRLDHVRAVIEAPE
ncbi:MAG: potassium/proton antiporter [Anaerolineae bacterium]|nr:potassium/proton antiporter [Anaerolineae bacterium]